ncbi:MAG: hypothetical protein H6708_07755 [Kofleriaceae bacterium]|nr:hypothetical protein [Kofleriaceae bacterium]
MVRREHDLPATSQDQCIVLDDCIHEFVDAVAKKERRPGKAKQHRLGIPGKVGRSQNVVDLRWLDLPTYLRYAKQVIHVESRPP